GLRVGHPRPGFDQRDPAERGAARGQRGQAARPGRHHRARLLLPADGSRTSGRGAYVIVAAPPRLRERVGRQERTTPGHLQWLILTIGVASGTVAVIGAGALFTAQRAVAGMHHETVQSIVGAQRLHATLADADRAEANAFLAGATEAVGPHRQYEADI